MLILSASSHDGRRQHELVAIDGTGDRQLASARSRSVAVAAQCYDDRRKNKNVLCAGWYVTAEARPEASACLPCLVTAQIAIQAMTTTRHSEDTTWNRKKNTACGSGFLNANNHITCECDSRTGSQHAADCRFGIQETAYLGVTCPTCEWFAVWATDAITDPVCRECDTELTIQPVTADTLGLATDDHTHDHDHGGVDG